MRNKKQNQLSHLSDCFDAVSMRFPAVDGLLRESCHFSNARNCEEVFPRPLSSRTGAPDVQSQTSEREDGLEHSERRRVAARR